MMIRPTRRNSRVVRGASAKVTLAAHPSCMLFLLLLLLLATLTSSQRCGCSNCTETILNTDARGQTCGDRIDGRIASGGNETDACEFVARTYPLECGPFCHPQKCDGQAPALCNCGFCSEDVWNTMANGFTCGQRVLFIISSFGEEGSCRRVAEQYPSVCGSCHPFNCTAPPTTAPTAMPVEILPSPSPFEPQTPRPTLPPFHVSNPDARCGCFACDDSVLSNVVFGYSCRERIEYLQTRPGGNLSELEACYRVAEDFPDNVCGPACHPEKCSTMFPTTSPTRGDAEFCTCYDCNETVLSRTVKGFTCGERIRFLQTAAGGRYTENEACDFVAREFGECWSCGPDFCDGRAGTMQIFSWLLVLALCVPVMLLV